MSKINIVPFLVIAFVFNHNEGIRRSSLKIKDLINEVSLNKFFFCPKFFQFKV